MARQHNSFSSRQLRSDVVTRPEIVKEKPMEVVKDSLLESFPVLPTLVLDGILSALNRKQAPPKEIVQTVEKPVAVLDEVQTVEKPEAVLDELSSGTSIDRSGGDDRFQRWKEARRKRRNRNKKGGIRKSSLWRAARRKAGKAINKKRRSKRGKTTF